MQQDLFSGWFLENTQKISLWDIIYACNDCPQTFTQASTLKTHRGVHTGQTPYVI